jgi:hypothetical protein
LKSTKYLSLSAAVLALVFSAGIAAAKGPKGGFTISQGASFTIGPTSGPQVIPVGTTGYTDALLNITGTRAYKFTFMGCGDTSLDNRFFVAGTKKFFDCKTSKDGDSFIVNLKTANVGPHSPFYFQSDADHGGPSVFNGEGPFDGTYTNGNDWSNTSIFYAIDGSTSSPGETSGTAVLLGLSDGGVPHDMDYQDLVVEISLPGKK